MQRLLHADAYCDERQFDKIENAAEFEIRLFYLNCSIIWFDFIQKNIDLKLKFGSDNLISFLIQLFEVTL